MGQEEEEGGKALSLLLRPKDISEHVANDKYI